MNFSRPDWVGGVHALESGSIEQMYKELSPELYRYAFRLTGNSEESEDILADAFIRLLDSLQHRKQKVNNIRAYLYRVVHNRAVDGFRRKKRVTNEVDVALLEADPGVGAGAVDILAVDQVREALWQLTDQQRQVIMLRYYQDLSYREIGEVLDKPTGAVKALKHRGLNSLRRIFLRKEEKGDRRGEKGQ